MVYLLHFDIKLHHAQHYLGYCKEGGLESRIQRHIKGRGSTFVKAMIDSGARFCIVKIWHNEDRAFERKLKNRKKSSSLCPMCKEARNAK